MFIIFLHLTEKKTRAAEFMEGHKAWIKRGFAEGVFLLTGSLEPGLGGGILAHGSTRAELQQRVDEDPFVVEGIVTPEIHELDPGMADERLQFLIS
ncbi:YciI family protein [Prosthecobacter sp.]|uniref:YciI family protein n=1 Tax=Prosthecobacter sp. TaxID=1965333 RepID=UPI003784D31B